MALFFPNDLINNLTVYKGGLISIGASKAIGNNIYLNEKDLNDTSMLIHEATHSYQKGGVGEMISSIYVQFVSYLTHGTRHYAYYYSINDSVENFNSEQEASLVQDFYVVAFTNSSKFKMYCIDCETHLSNSTIKILEEKARAILNKYE